MAEATSSLDGQGKVAGPSLRKEEPYWHDYHTYAKMRWLNRQLIEVFVTEFRDRTSEYYNWAIRKGLCNVNGRTVDPRYVVQDGDELHNRVHRHEPAVTTEPIKVLHRDDASGRLVIVKPGSIPVHAAGRYYKLTLLYMIRADLGIDTVYTSNRLDRLTSGIMICSTTKESATKMSNDFAMGRVRKAYVCRVRGRFPEGEVVCKEPLLRCDRQSGVSVVHALGKESETIFNRLSYDEKSDTSVVYCRPITGRTHQIRVHTQYLGHPIPNDPIYAHPIWDRHAPTIFKHLHLEPGRWKIEPESTLNVFGCQELDDVVAAIKMDKDDREDWSRWRDEVMFAELNKEEGFERVNVDGPNGEPVAMQKAKSKLADGPSDGADAKDKGLYCEECSVPLLPDPDASELYIYLHAIKYETNDWSYEDELPWWAREDWQEAVKKISSDPNAPRVVQGRSSEAGSSVAETLTPGVIGLAGRAREDTWTDNELDALTTLASSPDADVSAKIKTSSIPKRFPAVVFDVFGGMEDFVTRDLLHLFRAHSDLQEEKLPAIMPSDGTGHITISSGPAAWVAYDLYRRGLVSCAKRAYLKVAEDAMPCNILARLAQERRDIALAMGLYHRARKEHARNGNEKPLPPPEKQEGRTEAERDFVAALADFWTTCDADRRGALEAWSALQGRSTNRGTFRASADRTGYLLPTMNTIALEREVGNLIHFWLNGANCHSADVDQLPWRVDLQEANLNIKLKLVFDNKASTGPVVPVWRSKAENPPGSFLLLIDLGTPESLPMHRTILPNELIQTGTVLARYRAFAMCLALPLFKSPMNKGNQGRLRFWEPCVGTGGIAIELASLLRKKGLEAEVFASDIEATEVDKAKQTAKLCGVTNDHANVDEVVEFFLDVIDASDADAVERFVGRETVDGIITDLPWGRRALSHMAVSTLYPALMQTWCNALKPGACAVVMTAECNTLKRATMSFEGKQRKAGEEWYLALERVDVNGVGKEAAPEEAGKAENGQLLRFVECGYDVSLAILRKRPLVG